MQKFIKRTKINYNIPKLQKQENNTRAQKKKKQEL